MRAWACMAHYATLSDARKSHPIPSNGWTPKRWNEWDGGFSQQTKQTSDKINLITNKAKCILHDFLLIIAMQMVMFLHASLGFGDKQPQSHKMVRFYSRWLAKHQSGITLHSKKPSHHTRLSCSGNFIDNVTA